MVYGAEESEGPAVDPFDEGKMVSQGQHVINWCGFSCWLPAARSALSIEGCFRFNVSLPGVVTWYFV